MGDAVCPALFQYEAVVLLLQQSGWHFQTILRGIHINCTDLSPTSRILTGVAATMLTGFLFLLFLTGKLGQRLNLINQTAFSSFFLNLENFKGKEEGNHADFHSSSPMCLEFREKRKHRNKKGRIAMLKFTFVFIWHLKKKKIVYIIVF